MTVRVPVNTGAYVPVYASSCELGQVHQSGAPGSAPRLSPGAGRSRRGGGA